MEVIAQAFITVKHDFLSDLQGALSSAAGYHSAAFKILLKLQHYLLDKIDEVDEKRWGKLRSHKIYREGQIIKSGQHETL